MTARNEFRIAILAGSKSDLDAIHASPLFRILEEAGVTYELEIISSDRDPERLRSYCLAQKARISVAIGIAGGVPNLPICMKAWMRDIMVISVPLGQERDYALASLTTPGDLPVIVGGLGPKALEKAGHVVADIARLVARAKMALV